MSRPRLSRLNRKEEARNMRRAFVFGFLTLFLVILLLFIGIPALIRLAVFLGEVKKSPEPIQTGDVIPPPPVRFHSLPEATNSANLIISGFAEAGSTVEIFLDGEIPIKVLAENDGTFLSSSLVLTPGANEIYAVAVDESGNRSLESDRQTVSLDTEPPELVMSEPEDGATFSAPENRVTLKGKSETGITLRVNEKIVLVDPEGNFSYQLTLSEGENIIRVVATDHAGNSAEEEIKLNYQL